MAEKERPIHVETGLPRSGVIVEFAKKQQGMQMSDVVRLQLVRAELAKFGAS